MAKDTFYFSHDYNARNDIKIKKLMLTHGILGYGIYWAIIEDLYNNTNVLQTNYELIAYDLRVDKNIVESVINDFALFVIDNNEFGSKSVERRLEERNAKSVKARESVLKRWSKDTNVLPLNNDSNTIKEIKGKEKKEIKVNNIDERKLKFASTLEPFLIKYGKDMMNQFYKYWTQPNRSNTKFKQELEKTWELSYRLETWSSKNYNKTETKLEPKINMLK